MNGQSTTAVPIDASAVITFTSPVAHFSIHRDAFRISVNEATEQRAFAYLAKPIEVTQMLPTVEAALRRAEGAASEHRIVV